MLTQYSLGDFMTKGEKKKRKRTRKKLEAARVWVPGMRIVEKTIFQRIG